jgi:CheY-like chemotaxis protein
MARILIVEPHPEVRELLARIVSRLGHDPVVHDPDANDGYEVDIVLVEPVHWDGIEIARSAQRRTGARVVCVSISPPTEEALALSAVHLLKPFSLADLERALLSALEPSRPLLSA